MERPSTAGARRPPGLTRERIVAAAIKVLDESDERGLTFRALAQRLQTGHGAIQWHVATKSELMQAATAVLVAETLANIDAAVSPLAAIRAGALGIFDATNEHSWLGAELARPPWQGSMMSLFEHIGRQVQRLGATEALQFTATVTLLHYIVGASSQEAVMDRSMIVHTDRQEVLNTLASQWRDLDPNKFKFTRSVSEQMRMHDDRSEFLSGIDLLLAGITTSFRERDARAAD